MYDSIFAFPDICQLLLQNRLSDPSLILRSGNLLICLLFVILFILFALKCWKNDPPYYYFFLRSAENLIYFDIQQYIRNFTMKMQAFRKYILISFALHFLLSTIKSWKDLIWITPNELKISEAKLGGEELYHNLSPERVQYLYLKNIQPASGLLSRCVHFPPVPQAPLGVIQI